MVMACTATAMARRALIVLSLLLLLPCAAIADADASMHRALFDHLQAIRALSSKEGAAEGSGAVEQAEAEGDWLGALGVGDQAAEDQVPVVDDGDVTGALFAHLRAVQRQVQEVAEDSETVNGDGSGEGVIVELEAKEEEVEEDGAVVDPEVQERFRLLESALKGLRDDEDGSPKELRVRGAEDDGVVDLLENYAQETNGKLNRSDGASQPENDQSHGERRQSDHHIDHEHLHGHGHGQHRHHHGGAHANGGFSRVYDAHYHRHDLDGHSHGHQHGESIKESFMLPEEMAEEEDLRQYGFDGPGMLNAEQPSRLRGQELGVWLRAMGCSLLVSLASLICLMLLPCIISNGKPSETLVNALASFGAGAMLGDAFLHQLPHAFEKSEFPHSDDTHQHHHNHGHFHGHDRSAAAGQGHAHSLQDLSIGLAVLGGILLFFVVEKIVRRYEELSSHGGQRALGHSHHHLQKRKDEVKSLEGPEKIAAVSEDGPLENKESKSLETKGSDIKKRKIGKKKGTTSLENATSKAPVQPQQQVEASGGFVIGYLNLFSDAVHNFTDGMALGSAFLLHGTVGGWSRTLFLLAHELPQEVGDFGILVKSGFSVFEALAFNFLSALVALAGTAVGFIAGGFIYMSVGGVMPSMHDQGSSLISTLSQLVPIVFGMGVAVVISLAE